MAKAKKGLALAILASMRKPGDAGATPAAAPAPSTAAAPEDDAKETGEVAAAEEVLRAIHANDPKAFHESLEALVETCYPQLKDGDESAASGDAGGADGEA